MTAITAADIPSEIPRSSTSLEAFSRWLLAIALVVIAALAATYLLLAVPANDDFVRAAQPHQLGGWWPQCKHLYMTWQGRWAAFGLESAVVEHGDVTKYYPALSGAVLIINLIGLFVICRYFTRSASRWFSLGCTAGLAVMLWAGMPSVAEAVYWFVGTVENAMALSLSAMLIIGLICFRPTVLWMIVACCSTVFICGLHELYGAMLCIVLAAGTFSAYCLKSEKRHVWLYTLIAAVVGVAIVAGAPGNRMRMKSDGNTHSRHFVYDAKIAVWQLWHWSREWLFDPKLLAVSLWVACSPKLEASRPIWLSAKRFPFRLLVPIVWMAMLGVGFFAPSWAFGNKMPLRTLSANYMVFSVGWLLIVYLWTRQSDTRGNIDTMRGAGPTAIARLTLAAALLLTGNGVEGLHDLANHRAQAWHASVEKRFTLMRKNPGTDMVVPRLSMRANTLFLGEMSTDPTDFINQCQAPYFHLKSVRVPPLVMTGSALPSTRPIR